MKLNKVYLALLLLVIGALILAGCGGKEPAKQSAPAPESKQETNQGSNQISTVFKEYPIGDEQQVEGLTIAGVYFQPVPMEPDRGGLRPDQADIHLEADIVAIEGNKTGFGIGEFVPYLTVNYRLKNLDNGKEQTGTFMPMNAADGPHYGANVKMMGAGKYEVTFIIESPEKQGYLLHTDKTTGVEGRFWTKPIEVKWEFPYLGPRW